MKKSWTGHATAARIEYEGVVRYKYPNTRYVTTSPTKHRRIEIAGEVELTIDIAALCQYLGAKALRSKSGRSGALGGTLKAKIVRRTETPDDWHDSPIPTNAIVIEENQS